MSKYIRVLDQHGRYCPIKLTLDAAEDLVARGLAMPTHKSGTLKRGGVRLAIPLTVIRPVEKDTLATPGLDPNWMTKQRTVRRERVIGQGGSPAVVWAHRRPSP